MTPNPGNLPAADLWGQRVDHLGLRLEDSPVWPLVLRLHEELAGAGIDLRPVCFVSSEWGCPDGLPIIGIPFYLVDPRMYPIEEEHADDLEDDERILVGLRHEAGHAFNYAHRLYDDPEWTCVFGDFQAPYQDDYLPAPFATDFVSHLPGWYAQKHPDEDFAETFAVWLTPGSDWRERYAGTGALAKLEHVERVVARLGHAAPVVDPAAVSPDADELAFTLGDYYRRRTAEDSPPVEELAGHLDRELRDIFPASGIGNDAATLLWERRRVIMRQVSAYTGARLYAVRALLVFLTARLRVLALRSLPGKDLDSIVGVTALATCLTRNFLRTGHFAQVP